MVYEIDGKYYIMANHKFYEVKIDKQGMNGYDVKLVEKAKPIEYNGEINYDQIPLEQAYKAKKNNIID